MTYFLDFIFLTISACLCWVVWDATVGALGGVLVLVDLWIHTMLDG